MTLYDYEELRRVHEAIQKVGASVSEEVQKEKESMLLGAVKRVIELANLARKEGLLALEEAMEMITQESLEGFLKQMIMLVVDGTGPEETRKIGFIRYYSGLVRDYDALMYLIFLEGALSIQAGENPRNLEEKLKAMLPSNLYNDFCQKQKKELDRVLKEEAENIIEKLCTGKRLWNPKDSGYFVMKLADYVVRDITDKELERLMREIDNRKLVLVMKGLGGEARRHIFSCLSERLGKLIAEDMNAMGPVRAMDVLDATQELIAILIRLIDRGEIIDRYEYLVPFYDMFRTDTEDAYKKCTKVHELKKLVTEYEQNTTHMVE